MPPPDNPQSGHLYDGLSMQQLYPRKGVTDMLSMRTIHHNQHIVHWYELVVEVHAGVGVGRSSWNPERIILEPGGRERNHYFVFGALMLGILCSPEC